MKTLGQPIANLSLHRSQPLAWLAWLLSVCLVSIGLTTACAGAGEAAEENVFTGSSPCDEPIRRLLKIPATTKAELMEWKLTLYRDAKTSKPARYELRCHYGMTTPNRPGLAEQYETLEKRGAWRITTGTKSNPKATVFELDESVSLLQLDKHILQLLNSDRSFMVGNGGWSYTLNRAEAAEPRVDPLRTPPPSLSYTISPPATGPSVFGIFEGRTPAQGIARELAIIVGTNSIKAKWRVTLFQDPKTGSPTTYKIEGSLHRSKPQAGNWRIVRGAPHDPDAIVYQLDATETEKELLLLKGDDNVLFFLDHNRNPLVGHREFSYTLNRRPTTSARPEKE